MKTVLVTGGTGFIGVYLANELSDRGYTVTVYDKARNRFRYLNPQVGFELIDIRDHIFEGSFDYVYHLASSVSLANSIPRAEDHISTNIWGTYNIVESFPGSRVVFLSSIFAADANSFHGLNKKCAEHFINTHKNSVSIRIGSIFGEGQATTGSKIPLFVSKLKHNEKVNVKNNNCQKIEYTYVRDLVREIIRIGESKIKGQTETGYGSPMKELELYKLIAKISKSKENFKLVPTKKRPSIINIIKSKIKEPRYGFLEGLRRTIRWYLEEDINANMEGKSLHRV